MADLPRITRTPIDPAALIAAVSDLNLGGLTLFLGSVRRGPEDGSVTAIDYSAYEAMVTTEFDRILAEAAAQWPQGKVAACHRLGPVPAGQASIGIAAAMPHRAEAFAACRYVIEEAKRRLPVFKHEVFADGSRRWRANTEEPNTPPPPSRSAPTSAGTARKRR